MSEETAYAVPVDAPPGTAIEDTHASTEHAADAEHASGGLPQFEFQHWFGQIVYLIFLFVVLYFLISKVFAPRMRRVFDERAGTISGAVEAARQVQAEAAGQAEAAKREVEEARAASRATAQAAKERVTAEANARAASEEAAVAARIAEAETAISKTREAAMANVTTVAADAASAMVERLTGKAPTAAELKGRRLMPYFLDPHFYSLENPELWVGIGLVLFLAIVVFAGVPKLVAGVLDAKAAKIQAELDEAARLRAEAEALLAQIRKEKAEAEAQAAEMLKAAEDEARRMEAEIKAKLEESLARRQQLAERRIAQAEAQATADVKAAAVEQAARAAESILASRLAAGAPDPVLDQAVAQIGDRLN